jgi:hypothetical protein
MWNIHLVQRLAERKGSGGVVAGGKERRCAYLVLAFGLVHLLANIPIWRGREGLEGIERFVLPFLYVSLVSVFYFSSFLLHPCEPSPVYPHIPLALLTTVPRGLAEFKTFTRMYPKFRGQILKDQIRVQSLLTFAASTSPRALSHCQEQRAVRRTSAMRKVPRWLVTCSAHLEDRQAPAGMSLRTASTTSR